MSSPATLDLTRWELLPPDGPPLRGETRAPVGAKPRSAVVICHGFKGFRSWGFFPPLARFLARRGHVVVTFDFARNGVGADGVDFSALELFEQNTHSRNVAEIRMVMDALLRGELGQPPPERVGLFGHSRGGGEAILAAAADRRVRALVTWAAIATVERWSAEQVAEWRRGEVVQIPNTRTGQRMPMGPGYWRDIEWNRERLDIRRAAARLRIPWLIVHGEADASVAPEDARALYDAAGKEVEMLLVPGAGHTFGAVHPFAGSTPELREAARATADWFGTHLG